MNTLKVAVAVKFATLATPQQLAALQGGSSRAWTAWLDAAALACAAAGDAGFEAGAEGVCFTEVTVDLVAERELPPAVERSIAPATPPRLFPRGLWPFGRLARLWRRFQRGRA